MRKTVLRAIGFAVITTAIIIGCGDSGNQDKTLNVGDLLNAITGTGGGTTPTPDNATYTLTVNISPVEGGSVSRTPNADGYKAGTPVTVTATPKPGYEFLGWTGVLTSADNSVTITMDANKALYAGFQKIGSNLPKYTIYFNPNGATGMTPEIIQRDSGSVVSLPDQAGLTREWHSFAGWSTESDGNGKAYKAYNEYTVTNTVTLFAKWTRDTYTLTVNTANGGTTSRNPNKTLYEAGTQVTVTATPNEHVTFTGWSGASSSKDAVITITMDSNKELTPNFTQNIYTLTTNVSIEDGGNVSRSPDAKNYRPGTKVTVTATPATAQGYIFTGWSGASNATTPTITITMDDNKTLTAGFGKLDAKKFTVTFNGNGAATGSVSAITADSGATISLPNQGSLDRNAYRFGGWNTNSGGTGTKYSVEQIYQVTKDVTLYAKWIPIYTVTFNSNGATGNAPTEVKTDSGSSVTMPIQGSLDKIGCTFGGWNTKSDGTGTNYNVEQKYTVINNVTFYAKWTINTHTLTTTANPSGSGSFLRSPNQTNYDYGTNVLVTATVASGYVFNGWSGDASGTANPLTITMDKNKTVTANFVAVYTLTIAVSPIGGGTVSRNPSQDNYNAGTSVTVTATAESGYTFMGWSGASTGTTNSISISMNGNKKLTAIFYQVFTDSRDTKTYKIVEIGGKKWMAENLNYQPLGGNSWCYGNDNSNCANYGRLYDWNTAKTVCPSGWHLSTRADWDNLAEAVGGNSNESDTYHDWYDAGKYLKSKSGWTYYSVVENLDTYGFSALPGGYRNFDGSFYSVGYRGIWWTTTEYGGGAHRRDMYYNYDYVVELFSDKASGFSVRCVKDD